jgi:hypothetical protein
MYWLICGQQVTGNSHFLPLLSLSNESIRLILKVVPYNNNINVKI